MSIKQISRGTWIVTEYQVSWITASGESLDIDMIERKKDAVKAARDLRGYAASVVEKVVKKYPSGRGDAVFTEVAIFGDEDAIRTWRGDVQDDDEEDG